MSHFHPMTADQVRIEREAREAKAAERAATLPVGDYYADGCYVSAREPDFPSRAIVKCETHWDACLVLLALKPEQRA